MILVKDAKTPARLREELLVVSRQLNAASKDLNVNGVSVGDHVPTRPSSPTSTVEPVLTTMELITVELTSPSLLSMEFGVCSMTVRKNVRMPARLKEELPAVSRILSAADRECNANGDSLEDHVLEKIPSSILTAN